MRCASYGYFDEWVGYLRFTELELNIPKERQNELCECVARGISVLLSLQASSAWVLEINPNRFELHDIRVRALYEGVRYGSRGEKLTGQQGCFEDLVRQLSEPVSGVECPEGWDVLEWHGLELGPEASSEEWFFLEMLWQVAGSIEEGMILSTL